VAGVTFEDRVQALASLGLTDRQTRFLVTVALHGGYCLRRQYTAFAGVRYGKNVRDFLDGLVERGLAARFTYRADRGHVYHVNRRPLYRAIGQEDNRNRRTISPALIARKLMLLDFVLGEPDVRWFATEDEKVSLFVHDFGVPEVDLPKRVYDAARVDDDRTVRFFVQKLPIYLAGDPPVPHFLYLAMESGPHGFELFLRDHGRLLRRLPAWAVVCLRPSHLGPLAGCELAFDRFVRGEGRGLGADLERYFSARRAIEREEFTRLSVAELNQFRAARRRFATPAIEASYAAWLAADPGASASADVEPGQRTGRLIVRQLAHPYDQFGTMAGVA
jgi:hypothetical protein